MDRPEVVTGEREGNSIPAVFKSESAALSFIKSRIAKGTLVNADESVNWNELHSRFEMKRINHQEAYSFEGACTNQAEEFFSRMRRAEIGHFVEQFVGASVGFHVSQSVKLAMIAGEQVHVEIRSV